MEYSIKDLSKLTEDEKQVFIKDIECLNEIELIVNEEKATEEEMKLLKDFAASVVTKENRVRNLVNIIDGYFAQGGHHLNVNVFNRSKLIEAMEHPELYPNLTIRVSGYAVNFHKLSKEQQKEVVSRTFHEKL